MTQSDQEELFFITEEIAAEMIAAGYEFEPPPTACTVRLRDVLEGMSDGELALQQGPRTCRNPAGVSRSPLASAWARNAAMAPAICKSSGSSSLPTAGASTHSRCSGGNGYWSDAMASSSSSV